MKTEINKMIDAQQDEMIAFGKELFIHPELGYKELKQRSLFKKNLKSTVLTWRQNI